ncbi:1-phosphofructokinase family hexose kinase [Streptomyces atratus]|uniref:1-phosphofructokinase n=1 Tax=Streptomyces atratus TaxID=1893 RepID=A0A2Z5JQT0_STRAR|nr:1-phosphofructokinase family hexose kinase [Streptomyces atratus]AXE82594.1 1-phosphofructokinase [Streptomyces atratus]
MILTVTLNAALDVTYVVDDLVPHASHRVLTSYERAGGKGVNVARVLAVLDTPSTVTGLAGGTIRAGLRDELVTMTGDSRRTVTIVSRADGDATVFNNPGPHVDLTVWARFEARFTELVRDASVVVLSGSLPPGLPTDAYARLVRLSAGAGAATVLDTSGPPLLAALAAGPSVVKPNAAEIAEITGEDDMATAVGVLRGLGAHAVVASCGPQGLYAVALAGAWRAAPVRPLSGNPTGAGDACVAALAAGLHRGDPWPHMLREAVALSAAAVPCPMAGDVAADIYDEFRTTVSVEDACP